VYVLYCAQDDDELCGCKLLYPIDERKKKVKRQTFASFFWKYKPYVELKERKQQRFFNAVAATPVWQNEERGLGQDCSVQASHLS
jgi:hypothetical protein